MRPVRPIRALVPMKPAQEAKSRLAPALDAEGRAALALLLLQRVLRALRGCAIPLDACVLGGDAWVRRVSADEGAQWAADGGRGLNGDLRQAAVEAFAGVAGAVLALPGDLGLLGPADVEAIVAASCGLRNVVLARAASDGGTNAVLVPRGVPFGWRFGPDSFRLHMEAARDAGATVAVCSAEGLAFDLDTPEDLAAFLAKRPEAVHALEQWRLRLRGLAVPSPSGLGKGAGG